MSKRLTLAYLTGRYARASDSFVRAEVRALRGLGHTVHTFSIRRPEPGELVSDEIRAEHDSTEYVLAAGPYRLLGAMLRMTLRRPLRMARAARLAARIGWPGAKGRLWPFMYLVEATYLAERLEALGVQHLHDHIAEGSASVAMLAGELTGIGWSFTVHGPGEFDRAPLLALDEKAARARFVVAISDFARSQLLRWARVEDWQRVHVVRCGVDGSFLARERDGVRPGTRLVSIGRLEEQKGLPVLLQAAASLARNGVPFELNVIGEGPLRGELERLVRDLGLDGRVSLSGWATASEVTREIERSRALVLSSFAEGLPVAIMESLALGRPVVATDVGAVSELVRSGETGWLVPPGSAQELAGAMRQVLAAAPAELDRLGAAGAALIAERHAAATETARLAELFAASVEQDRARR